MSDDIVQYTPDPWEEQRRQEAWQQWYWQQQQAAMEVARRRRNTAIGVAAGATGMGVAGGIFGGIGMALLIGVAACFGVFLLFCLLFLIVLI
jgi:hypothetical protein